MTTSTKLTALIIDAVNMNPNGFTLNIQNGKLIDHGIAVGGYHKPNGSQNWLRLSNDGAGFTVPFEVLRELVEESWEQIESAGFVGGWLSDGVLILDIVELYDCVYCSIGFADASPFVDAYKLKQDAVGWLCPNLFKGYKTVTVGGW